HIGRLTVGGQYTEYALDPHSEPSGVAVGPDGALWFTEEGANKIGRMTTSGQVREFALPSREAVQCGQLCPYDIAAGPAGALWFTNSQSGGPGIGRITTGGTTTLYPTQGVPGLIVAGPDGNLWFAVSRNGAGPELGRITPGGTVTEFPIPGGQTGV